MNPKFGKRSHWIIAVVMVAMIALPWVAFADNVVNDVTVGGTDTFPAGGSTTVGYKVVATGGDGLSGCNASDGSAATVTINAPAGVTATPGSLTFTTCNDFQNVTFTSSTPGDYSITVSVSDSGTGSYSTGPAAFTLHVLSPPTPSDSTLPAITINTPGDDVVYFLNEVVYADYSCQDEAGGSGLASCVGTVANGEAIDTSSVGPKSFTVDAEDNAGNTASLTHNYTVIYDFDGFFRPVDNLPTLNVAKAGSAIPVKFSLSGDQGLSIFASGYPKSQVIECNSTSPVEGVDETVTAGSSSLSYDSSIDQYNYVWKTAKSWTGCRQLVVQLIDGQFYGANFMFTK